MRPPEKLVGRAGMADETRHRHCAGYMLEAARNVSGGLSHGSAYTGWFWVDVEIDWNKLAGVRGLKSHTLFVSNSGRNLSKDRLI